MSPISGEFGTRVLFRSIEFDASEFFKAIDSSIRKVRRGTDEALAVVGLQMLNDALFEPPTAPVDTGRLAGSGAVHVGAKRITTARNVHPKGTPLPQGAFKRDVDRDVRSVHVSFNTPYAEYVHEHPEIAFKEPSAGGYLLTAKLDAHAEEYKELYLEELGKRFKE